jgi:hypothetical protein
MRTHFLSTAVVFVGSLGHASELHIEKPVYDELETSNTVTIAA